MLHGNCVRMMESEFAFVENSLTITEVIELVDNLSDYKFCDKGQLVLKEKSRCLYPKFQNYH